MTLLPREYTTKDSRPLLVRLSTSADALAVISAINAICAERTYLVTDRYLSTSQWEKILHTPTEYPGHLLLVPEVDGQVIGWCRVFPNDFSPRTQHTGEVGIGLLQPFREVGIGTAVMECAIEWARTHGLEKLTVSAFSTNLRAINLFKKKGFVATGRRYKQYKISEEYVDEILMERFL